MSAPQKRDLGSGVSAPEGVVVLGMHRSGTSLITRLVSLLGLSVCRHDDLLVGRARNPRGHWESKSLLHFNDHLLEEQGCMWFCPPLLEERAFAKMLDRHGEQALMLLERAHPVHPWVWKDPRTCVLMPFWTAVLGRRAVYVLVVRHPLEVSDSLARRSGSKPPLSIALWERYTRAAMLGAAGQPLLLCTYDAVLADPIAWSERLRALLAGASIETRPVDAAAVQAFVMDELRHSRRSWGEVVPGELFSEQQAELARAVRETTAQSSYVPPALGGETPGVEASFEEIRRLIRPRAPRVLGRRRLRGLVSLPARLVTPVAARGEETDGAAPPVSVVLACGGPQTLERALAAIVPTLPSGSEVLVPDTGAGTADGRLAAADEGISVREIAAGAEGGGTVAKAAALSLGVHEARGRMVVLTTGALERCEPWYEAIAAALEVPEVGGAAPVLLTGSPDGPGRYGLLFADADLRVRPLEGDESDGLVPTGLLPDAVSAYLPALLAAAGGVDPAFDSACAAIAELSVRLWRLGFRCCIAPEARAWASRVNGDRPAGAAALECGGLYDRLRIAALHLDGERLQAFRERAIGTASYPEAAERLDASDVASRRATIDALCPFPAERYFEHFPPQPVAS